MSGKNLPVDYFKIEVAYSMFGGLDARYVVVKHFLVHGNMELREFALMVELSLEKFPDRMYSKNSYSGIRPNRAPTGLGYPNFGGSTVYSIWERDQDNPWE